MKVIGIVSSPRKGGNTEILVREALKAAREAGAETELVSVAKKSISPCDGCGACEKNGICKIKDDMQVIYQQLESADGIVFGTPVYFLNVTACVFRSKLADVTEENGHPVGGKWPPSRSKLARVVKAPV